MLRLAVKKKGLGGEVAMKVTMKMRLTRVLNRELDRAVEHPESAA